MRLRHLADPDHLPALDLDIAHARPALELGASEPSRILLLYGSLRDRSYSRLAVEEAPVCCVSSARRLASSIQRIYRSRIR